jgi:Alkylmercury lyase
VFADDDDVRLAVYRELARSGLAPSADELARLLGVDEAEVTAALARLAEARLVVLGPDGALLLAHPFATISFGFAVMGAATLWWGGCAWDSFALPHLLPDEPEVVVSTRCPGCGRALAWVVDREVPPAGEEVAHFLMPAAHMWDDVVHTCGHQRLFCDRSCVDTWLTRTGQPIGYVMDLATLWRLARGWYAGRLDPGYERREPAEAAAYFKDVGLAGPFWGL